MTLFSKHLKCLPVDGLYLLYQDATNRIGSNYSGGDPDFNYIRKQEEIISAVQEELKNRATKKGEM